MNILNTYNEFDTSHFELNVDHYGAEICDSNYAFGPSMRDNYVLHFIIDGKGKFTIDNKTTALQTGDLFILPKGKVTFYQADEKEPWTYVWVGFSGSRAENLLNQSQLLEHYYCHSHTNSKILDQLVALTRFRDRKLDTITELELLAELYKLLAYLIEEFPSKTLKDSFIISQNYVRQAQKLIHSQFDTPIRVSYIAQKLNLNRSYLYKIFKEQTGYSIKDYILKVKMDKGAELLLNPELNISQISNSIGFADALAFSKTFKKQFKQSPSQYRKSNHV